MILIPLFGLIFFAAFLITFWVWGVQGNRGLLVLAAAMTLLPLMPRILHEIDMRTHGYDGRTNVSGGALYLVSGLNEVYTPKRQDWFTGTSSPRFVTSVAVGTRTLPVTLDLFYSLKPERPKDFTPCKAKDTTEGIIAFTQPQSAQVRACGIGPQTTIFATSATDPEVWFSCNRGTCRMALTGGSLRVTADVQDMQPQDWKPVSQQLSAMVAQHFKIADR